MIDFGLHLCAGSPTDREGVGLIPWQKGLYINGTMDDLTSGILMLDQFFCHLCTSNEFDEEVSKSVHIINETILNFDSVKNKLIYTKYIIEEK